MRPRVRFALVPGFSILPPLRFVDQKAPPMTDPVTMIGFSGLGRMGWPMATNLVQAGFALTVHNRTQATARRFADEVGGTVVADPGALAACDAVITMLADDVASQAVWSAVLAGGQAPSLAIEMSTVSPAHVRRLAQQVARGGGSLLDAPVVGSTPQAAQAILKIIVGGPAETLARARPVLSALGDTILPTGAVGTGAHMKLAINSLLFSQNQALAEALVLANAGGIDTATAYDIIAHGSIFSPMMRARRPYFEDEQTHPPTFALKLARKDVGLALVAARAAGLNLPQNQANFAALEEAVTAGYGERDMAAILAWLREHGSRA